MGEVTIIGVDRAKNVFQAHGAAADGSVVFGKKLSRLQFTRFMAEQPNGPVQVLLALIARKPSVVQELLG